MHTILRLDVTTFPDSTLHYRHIFGTWLRKSDIICKDSSISHVNKKKVYTISAEFQKVLVRKQHFLHHTVQGSSMVGHFMSNHPTIILEIGFGFKTKF